MWVSAELEVGRSLYLVFCFSRPCCFHSFLNSLELEIEKNEHLLRVHSMPSFHIHFLTSLSLPPVRETWLFCLLDEDTDPQETVKLLKVQ